MKLKLRLQPLTRRERRVVAGGALMLLAVLFYVLVQQPLLRTLSATRADRDQQQSQFDLAVAMRQALPEQQSRVDALRQSTSKASASLPNTKDEPGLLRSLAQLASARGVMVRELSFAASTEADGVTSYPLRLAVSGPPAAAWQFLAGLENLDRLVQVRSVSYQNQTLTLEAAVFSEAAANGK